LLSLRLTFNGGNAPKTGQTYHAPTDGPGDLGIPTAILVGLAIGSGAVALGLLLTLNVLIAFGLVFGVGAGVFVLSNLRAGLYAVLATVALLPFGTLPFSFALTPTFLDLALGGFLLVYLFEWMTGRRRGYQWVPMHVMVIIFLGWLIFCFIAGLGNASPTTTVLRRFAELLLSISMVLVLTDVFRDAQILRRVVLVLLLVGALQALIGIGLYFLNDETANRALNVLGRFGYPRGDVLRFVEDNPEQGERAIGSWVDPNAYGGFLLMVAALAGTQALAERPVTGRRWLALALFGVIAVAVLLTKSRGAWLALGAAVFFIALVRYRWILVIGVVAVALLLPMPFMQPYLERLSEGLAGQDLATQMRFGEYKDALILIGRYPLIGVGFTGTPERDIYLGVSSIYLKIAGGTGLIGLAMFLLLMAECYRFGFVHRKDLKASPAVYSVWLGASAGLFGALVSGVVDHFYFNIEFHGAVTMLWLYVSIALSAALIARRAQANPALA
jgi:polysaccharide biosynthesis protein PslJ